MELQPKQPSIKGPDQWFSGTVWLDTVVRPHDASRVNVAVVRFAPGARTAWHSHQGGQTLYVTDGRGLVQSRGEAAVEIRSGDVVYTPDGEEHWHGAAGEHFMTHVSVTEGDPTWGPLVTDDEYRAG